MSAVEQARGNWSDYPDYRATCAEWCDSLPAHWELCRLKYAVSMDPETLSEDTPESFELEYIDIGNVNDRGEVVGTEEMVFSDAPSRARKRVQSGDTIISTVRTYLKAIAHIEDAPENLIVSTGFAVLRPCTGVNPRFLWRLIQSPEFVNAVMAHSEGIGYPAIASSDLARLPIWLPPLSEQRAIAEFLDRETGRIDSLIEKKRRLIELLEEKRTALITRAVTKGLDPDAPLKPSGVEWLGDIPEHWEVARIKQILRPTVGAMKVGPFGSQLLSSEMTNDGLIKVYNQRNVISGDLGIGEDYITQEKFAELRAFEVYPGDILVTTRGTIGRCLILPEKCERGILHPCLIRMQPDTERVAPGFLTAVVEDSDVVKTQLLLLSNSTTIEVVYSDDLGDVRIPLPPHDEQRQILGQVHEVKSRMDALTSRIDSAITKLQEYRTALISAAVTGKIDVRDM